MKAKYVCECNHTMSQHTSDGCLAALKPTKNICPCNNGEIFGEHSSNLKKIQRKVRHEHFGIRYVKALS